MNKHYDYKTWELRFENVRRVTRMREYKMGAENVCINLVMIRVENKVINVYNLDFLEFFFYFIWNSEKGAFISSSSNVIQNITSFQEKM